MLNAVFLRLIDHAPGASEPAAGTSRLAPIQQQHPDPECGAGSTRRLSHTKELLVRSRADVDGSLVRADQSSGRPQELEVGWFEGRLRVCDR